MTFYPPPPTPPAIVAVDDVTGEVVSVQDIRASHARLRAAETQVEHSANRSLVRDYLD